MAHVLESCFAVASAFLKVALNHTTFPVSCACVHVMKIAFHAWTKQSCLKTRWKVFSFAQS